MTGESGSIDDLCINTIRVLSTDAVEQAASGHPGMPMGAAAMAYVRGAGQVGADAHRGGRRISIRPPARC
ncbi:MAG TPA: hypothetical protein VMS64_33945 [Candidatus Methylomirabilis sp.]|nr:hypothetical protein [Candidatus Methylomirabilis sp.]